MNGLVERFNKTLKAMLRKVIGKDGKDWDLLIPYLMFAVREVPQASTGFSPFELLYGRQPHGIRDIAKETWENQPSTGRNMVEYIIQMQDRIERVTPIVREHFGEHLEKARTRSFNPRDRVMVLVPTRTSNLFTHWQGPCEIIEAVAPVNYKVHQPGRCKEEQIYHLNLLKPWVDREPQSEATLVIPSCNQVEKPNQIFLTKGGSKYVNVGPKLDVQQRDEVEQRLMDRVLRPHSEYASVYIDDIVTFSEGWEEHLPRVKGVLQALSDAVLAANP